jgi:hypothetical protein
MVPTAGQAAFGAGTGGFGSFGIDGSPGQSS